MNARALGLAAWRGVRGVAVVAIGLQVACSDVTVPEGVQLSCSSDNDCPGGLRCDVAAARCMRGTTVEVESLTLDTLTAEPLLVGRPFADAGGSVTVHLTLSAAPARAPTVHLTDGIAVDTTVVAVAGDDAFTFTAEVPVTGSEADGVLHLVVEAEDTRGVVSALDGRTGVTFDYTPPLPAAVSLQRVPDPRRTPVALDILDETVVGPAIDVRVIFSASEAVFVDGSDAQVAADPAHVVPRGDQRAPAVTTDGAVPLTFERDTTVNSPFIFALVWTDAAADGAHDVVVHLTDLAGNATVVAVPVVDSDADGVPDNGLVVDTQAPAAPDVGTPGRVVFERAPWGRLDDATPDLYRVFAAAGATEPGARVLVSRDADLRLELARTTASNDGAFTAPSDGAPSLPVGDIATVYVRAVDAAGNAGPTVGVRDIRWHVTPLGKRVGRLLENPHAFFETAVHAPQLAQGGLVERGGGEIIGAALHPVALETVGGGTWRRVVERPVSLLSPTNSGVADATVATDPVHGVTLVMGRREFDPAVGASGYVGRGTCGRATADVRVRRADGLWHTAPTAPQGLADYVGQGVAAAYVPPLGRIVVLAYGGTMYSFDGAAWRQECAQLECVEGNDEQFLRAPGPALVWDPIRGALVGTLNSGEIVEYVPADDLPKWRRTGVAAPFPAYAVFFDAIGKVVFANGSGLSAWDGAALVPLCTDDACIASAPPVRTGANVAYDHAHNTLVMFGGAGDVRCSFSTSDVYVASGGLSQKATASPIDTWTFDGILWTQHVAAAPPGRTRHAMAWDPVRNRVLLVGGDECECLGEARSGLDEANFIPGLPNDTWEWDGETWARVTDPSAPAGFLAQDPGPRRDHVVTEDPQHGGVLLYSGGATTYVFRDDGWYVRSDGSSVMGSAMAALATSPAGEIFGLGGGMPSGGSGLVPGAPFLGTVVDGVVGLACPDNPTVPECVLPFTPRWGGVAWHDGARLYFYGGADPFDTQSHDYPTVVASDALWSWTPAGWTQPCAGPPCSDVRPGRRLLARAVLDGEGRAVVFGGMASANSTNAETWVWANDAWTQIQTEAPAPEPRMGHVLAYDAARDAVVLAYGTDLGGQDFQTGGPNGPVLNAHQIPDALSDVWELHADTWTRVPQSDVEGDGAPSPRSSVSGAGLPGGGVLLYGGTPSPAQTYGEIADFFVATPRSDETWLWDGGAQSAPSHRFIVHTASIISLLASGDTLTGADITWQSTASRTDDDTSRAVDVLWWDGAQWVTVDPANLVDCGAGCVAAHLDAVAVRRAVTNGASGDVLVAVRPREANGPGPGRAVLRTGGVEVALHWRRAPAL